MKNDMEYLYNSTYSGRIKDLNPKFKYSMKPSTLSKDGYNLQKITETNIISTSGEQPLLLYKKKENKISHSFDYKMTKKNSDKNIYISDGGLKLKNEKYNYGYNNTNTNANQNKKHIKSLRTYLESINVNKLLKTPSIQNKKQGKTNQMNSKKKMQADENILYKTVRGSSNRPIFQKKFYNNDKDLCRTGDRFYVKSNMEMKKIQKNKPKKVNILEESKKTEETKNDLINSLINGALKNNGLSIQNSENKITPKKVLADKKKQYLERNGIGISDVNLDENDDENDKQNEKDEIKKMSKTANNFNHIKFNSYVKTSNEFSPKQKNFYMTLNNDTHFLNSKSKKQNKPIIDQFEYIKKINKHKRLCTQENLPKKDNKLFLSEDNGIKSNQLNDSFRHKNQANTQNSTKINNFMEKTYLKQKKGENPSSLVDINDEWPYSHKRSYRSPKELYKFVKEKKLQSKKKANKDELEKNKKLFIKFKNLYNLNYKRANNTITSNENKEKEKEKDKDYEKEKAKTISIKLNTINKSYRTRPNKPLLKRKKEANEYYVGNDSIINSRSTLIDPNEYYLNVLESQQLLVNSGLNKIENESDEETEEITDGNEINMDINLSEPNELKTSKEQIQKITKKESKKIKPNNVNNINNIGSLNINNIKNKIIIKNEPKANDKNADNNIKSNINAKAKTIIKPNDVIKLVEILKSIIQKKIYVTLYKSYINNAIIQHYYMAITYFIAVCKQQPFRSIEEYCNYKTYNQTFRKLLIPFLKKYFHIFVNNLNNKRKIEFLTIFLSKFFKYKVMEKIYVYSKVMEENEEEIHFKLVIFKIMKTLFSPHLKIVFDKLKNYNKDKIISIEKEIVLKNKPSEDYDILNHNQTIENPIMEDRYKKIKKRYLEYSPTHNNKAKSFTNKSFSQRSHENIGNHTFDMDQWRHVQKKLVKHFLPNDNYKDEEINEDEIKKYMKFNYPQNNSFNSKKSEKSGNLSSEKKKNEGPKINNIKNDIKKEKNNKNNIPDIKKNNNIKVEDEKEIPLENKKNKGKNEEANINTNFIDVKSSQNSNISNSSLNQNRYEKTHNHIYMEVSNVSNKPDIQTSTNNTKVISIKSESMKKPEKVEEDNKIINKKEIIEKEDIKIIPNNDKKNEPKQIKDEKPKNSNNINNKELKVHIKNEKVVEPEEALEKPKLNRTGSENDISADRDLGDSVEWEYNLSASKNKLQNSTNSENKKSEEQKSEDFDINYDINIINGKNQNKIDDDIVMYKEDPKIIKKEIVEKKDNKIDLIDDDDEIEDFENEDKKDLKDKKKTKTLIKDKNTLNTSEDEYLNEFKDIEDINSESENREKEKEKEKKDKNDKSRNVNSNNEIKDEEKIESEIISKPSVPINKEILKKIKDNDKFIDELSNDILKKILLSEITSNKVKLIPHKSFKYDLFSNLSGSQSNLSASNGSSGLNIRNDLGLLGLSNLSDDLSLLNDSIMSNYTAFSVFNRTIKEKKKEHSLYLYYRKIAPKLIRLIKEEIYLKYDRIYENISMPLKNQSVGLMMSLSLQDADMLRDNYKCNLMSENIRNIIDKEKILKKFEPINRHIRSQDNLASDNFYDNMLNECLVDTAIELINKERLYGENGDPLEWSSRTHELVFKYKKNEPKKLAKFVCSNLLKTLHTRIGLITENYDNLNPEQINNERDKRLIENIRNELDDDEYQWRNLEMEETQLKVEIAELIIDQLYNENIEILEHIQYSRNRPDLYQNKSIYACEEIPKLSFQQTTTENAAKDKDDGDEVINV